MIIFCILGFWVGRGVAYLGLHKVIRVAHVVVFPMDFNLLCDRGQQLGVLKWLGVVKFM